MGNILNVCAGSEDNDSKNSKQPLYRESENFEKAETQQNNQQEDFEEEEKIEKIEIKCSILHDKTHISLNSFKILKQIGQGSFGKVYLVQKKTNGNNYAIKILRKDKIDTQNKYKHAIDERKILQDTNNPFVVNLHYAFQSKQKLYLVMEFVNGGPFSEQKAKFYVAEIVMAISFLHNQGIIFRDLKPENILLDSEGHVKLTDFGLAKELNYDNGDLTHTVCGTPEYLAPEVLLRQGYNRMVDYWTIGILLYELVTMKTPFREKGKKDIFNNILKAPVVMKHFFSDNLKSLINLLLQKNEIDRLGQNGIDEIKSHPFFSDINWQNLELKKEIPPWKPNVKDKLDLLYFDQKLVQKTPRESDDFSQQTYTGGQNAMDFDGFTLDPSKIRNASHISMNNQGLLFKAEQIQQINLEISERILVNTSVDGVQGDKQQKFKGQHQVSHTEKVKVKVRTKLQDENQ